MMIILAVILVLIGLSIYVELRSLVRVTAVLRAEVARVASRFVSEVLPIELATDQTESPPLGSPKDLSELQTSFRSAKSPRLWRIQASQKD